MKTKLEELKYQRDNLEIEIEQLEKDYAKAACPWSKDTVIEHTRTGKRYIIDEAAYCYTDWCVFCTYIRKDGSFGASTQRIDANQADLYRVLRGFKITDKGIVLAVEEIEARKLAQWREATVVK